MALKDLLNTSSENENKQIDKKVLIILIILAIALLPVTLTVVIVKSKKLSKKVKAILIAVVWLFFIGVGAANGGTSATIDTIENNTPIQSEVIIEETTLTPAFTTLENTAETINIGEAKEFSITIKRTDITVDNIAFENTNTNIVQIDNIEIKNSYSSSTLTFTCTALEVGTTDIRISLPAENAYSDYITITTEIGPTIKSFGFLTDYTQRMEEDDSTTYTITLVPGTITENDFKFIISDTSVVSVADVKITNADEKTTVEFTVYAEGVGTATLQLKATDELTESSTMSFEIEEKDTSRTVYTTPNGEKYHYSKSCAGSNAIETTEKKASKNHDPCKNCT